jgi:hypothetical protein
VGGGDPVEAAVRDDADREVVGERVHDGRPDAAAGGAPADDERVDAALDQQAQQRSAEERAGLGLVEDDVAFSGREWLDDPVLAAAILASAAVLHRPLAGADPDAGDMPRV